MSAGARHFYPPQVFWAGAALVAIAIGGAAMVRLGLIPPMANPEQARAARSVQMVEAHDLRFRDGANGAVLIDTGDGRTITAVPANSPDGFIRGVMRGLARDRHLRGIGPEAPFRLIRWSDGTMSLEDRATGRVIELWTFGATNKATFEALLAKLNEGQAA